MISFTWVMRSHVLLHKFGPLFGGFPLCQPGASGLAIIRYLGWELTDDLQYVGQALVGGVAMA